MDSIYNVWTELQDKPTDSCKKLQQSFSNDFGICMFNIRLSGNVGMAIRTACTLGFNEFIICGRHHYDRRFTVGAHNYINIHHWEEPVKVHIKTLSPNNYSEKVEYIPSEFVKNCKRSNWTPVFIEQGGNDIRNNIWKLIKKPLLVLGNESSGIPRSFINEVKKYIPETVVLNIPQWSVLRSMNVSTAATIAMWELRSKNVNSVQ